ncbi:MAG: hypothetical protein M3Z04_22940, partial [Chloroflexota bacterium]|nr:hypothetical protein [Chloroflexota bacterium]
MTRPHGPATEQEDAAWIRAGLEIAGGYQVAGALDGPAPGNWALVVQAGGPAGPVALKIMRGRHLGRPEVYRMFAHEARVLARFGTRIAAAGLLAQGYLHPPLTANAPAPADLYPDAEEFERALPDQLAQGGRPFLALEPVPAEATVLALLRGLSHGSDDPVHNRTVPLADALAITLAALDILAVCHAERLYFVDHKPEHLLWRDGVARFLDWNGGDWKAGPAGGSLPRADDQLDVLNFTGYVAYPLFTGRQLDGKAVQSIQRGTPQPPAVQLADGDLLPFYEATAWLDPALQRLLSRPFWNPGARFAGAAEMATALRAYEQTWRRESGGMDRQAARALADLAEAQGTLGRALHRFDRLLGGSVFKRPAAERPAAAREVQRLTQHVQRFYSARVLPDGLATGGHPAEPDSADAPATAPAAEPLVVAVPDYAVLRATFARLAATDPLWAMLADTGFAGWLDSLIHAAGGAAPGGDSRRLGAGNLPPEASVPIPVAAVTPPPPPAPGPALAPPALIAIIGQIGTIKPQ